jgi:hypothetical protein
MKNRDRIGEAVMVTRDDGLPPALADAASSSLTLRIARAGGRAWRRDDGRLAVAFTSPLAALRCALRVRWDMRAMFGDEHGFAMGIALAESEAADLAARSESGLVVSTAIRNAVEGEVDVDYEPLGEDVWLTLPRHSGRGVFRFKPWTSPRRRRGGLIAAVVMIAVTVIGLLLSEPPPPR